MTKPRILLTTTSFQDTPGEHHKLLAETGWEVVTARGPLNEADTLALMGEFDGYICGDDLITAAVIEKALPRLKVVSKYGIGVDKIDVKTLTAKGIPLLFTPGVNHTTVAEHTFLLLLAMEKNFYFHTDSTRSGGWKRKTGRELLEPIRDVFGGLFFVFFGLHQEQAGLQIGGLAVAQPAARVRRRSRPRHAARR